jgi:RNA polymerase sigma factor (sigma-70 family)
MHNGGTRTLSEYLRKLARPQPATDMDLLRRFVESWDQTAFELLVQRYGPLVRRVCRSALADENDADDVFQATFLLLCQKAGSLRRRNALGPWLHGVAVRLASRARRAARRRKKYETRTDVSLSDNTDQERSTRELRALIDQELAMLPDKLRVPLVLCYLEGKTQDEAGRQLGVPQRTLSGHLERGRELLRERLQRRGVELGVALMVTALCKTADAAVPRTLVASTLQSAMLGSRGTAAVASVSLARGMLLSGRIKWVILLTGLLLLVGGGAALSVALSDRPTGLSATHTFVPSLEKEHSDGPVVTLAGRVVDADGKAIPYAEVTAVARRPFRAGDFGLREDTLRAGLADAEGRFRLSVPADFPTWYPDRKVVLVADAAEHAPTTLAVPTKPDHAQVELKMTKRGGLGGTVLDPDGNPAAGVRVAVVRLGDAAWEPVQGSQQRPPTFWPEPIRTDARGEFRLPDLDPNQNVWLQFQDDRFALATEPARPAKEGSVVYRLAPARLLTGRVLAADTGKPLAHARLAIYAGDWAGTHSERHTALTSSLEASRVVPADALDARADSDGHFKLYLPTAEEYRVDVFPPEAAGYLALTRQIRWDQDTTGREEQFRLPHGIELRGRVIEADDAKPVAGAYAYYLPRIRDNPHYRRDVLCDRFTVTATRSDGTFRLAVPPGPATLYVYGPGWEFVSQVVYPQSLVAGPKRPLRYYADALVGFDLPADCVSHETTVSLRRGVTVSGSLTDAVGKPAGECVLFCSAKVTPMRNRVVAPLPARGGRFTLPGCDPTRTYPVLFLDATNRLGAMADVAGSGSAAAPPTVCLEHCVAARLQVLDADGHPAQGCRLVVYLLLEPDTATGDTVALAARTELADPYEVSWVDPINYRQDPVTDQAGWATLPSLVPGARYKIAAFGDSRWTWGKPFAVKPGETTILPELTLQRPRAK